MTDEARQDAISYPSTIFKKLRDKMSKQPIREKGQRVREKFKGPTASVKDEDIIQLCKQYKVKTSDMLHPDLAAGKGIKTKMDLLRRDVFKK